jgi:hypothetical protein
VTEFFKMPILAKLEKPKFDDFYGREGFQKYSDSIWYCIHEVVERDVSMLGKYGRAYDESLLARLNATRTLIASFRRYGMIAVNLDVQRSISKLLQELSL